MPASICPHCSAPNANPGKFCASCGRALPSPVKVAPRVISGKAKVFAQSEAGQAMQIDELAKQAKSASQILIVLGALSCTFGLLLTLVGLAADSNPREGEPTPQFTIVGITLLVFSAIYFSLGAWAKSSPLPATITGLVLYTSFAVVDLISAPVAATPSLVVKVIIIAALARSVSAGVKHRELLRRARQRANSTGQAPLR